MRCPLIVTENRTSLTIVRNGEVIEIPFPVKPYILCRPQFSEKEPKKYIDLWKKEELLLSKEEFNRRDEAHQFFMHCGQGNAYGNRMVDQLLLDQPDYFRQYAQTEPLRVLYFDIECLTKGTGVFPKPSKDPVIAIGVGGTGLETRVFMDYSEKKDCKDPDRKILEDFKTIFMKYDPDIVCGYNIEFFDIPYLVHRMQKLKMGVAWLTRDGSLPFTKDKRTGQMDYNLGGRVTMDLYHCVKKDQSLNGIKNRKLKTICRHFGIPCVEIDTTNTSVYLNKPELKDYQASDVEVLRPLFDIYFPQQEELADMLGIPLDTAINGYNSTIPKIYTGRRLVSMGMIPMENNEVRYGNTKFEAAYVAIKKSGKFDQIHKVDFASLYPSIMVTFNLGPDTVELVSESKYDPKAFAITATKDYYYINVPDENLQKNMLIRVDLTKESFIKKDMLKLFTIRKEIKKKMKQVDPKSAEWTSLNSKSWAIKVVMNIIYGFEGLKYARFGDMPVGVAIVALARWLIKSCSDRIGEPVIEVDTDGIYLSEDQDPEELDVFVSALVAENIPGMKSYLKFEREGPWKGYFYKAKNYCLLDGDEVDDIQFHGGCMKSSRTAKIYDQVIKQLAWAILNDANQDALKELVMKLRDIGSYQLPDFVQHVNLGKKDYKSKTAFQIPLMEQLSEALGKKVSEGESIDYYRTKEGYTISRNVTSTDQLDKDYYLKIVEKAQEVFGLQDIHKTPEELLIELRAAKKRELINHKKILNAFINGTSMDDPYTKGMTIERVKAEVEICEQLQRAMREKWPCIVCGNTELDLKPYILVCRCGWEGNPVKPPKPPRKKAVRKKKMEIVT